MRDRTKSQKQKNTDPFRFEPLTLAVCALRVPRLNGTSCADALEPDAIDDVIRFTFDLEDFHFQRMHSGKRTHKAHSPCLVWFMLVRHISAHPVGAY